MVYFNDETLEGLYLDMKAEGLPVVATDTGGGCEGILIALGNGQELLITNWANVQGLFTMGLYESSTGELAETENWFIGGDITRSQVIQLTKFQLQIASTEESN